MALAVTILAVAAQLYLLVLIARLILDVVMIVARTWRPSGVVAAIAEIIYTTSDPPIKALRRVIPPLRLGSFSLDLGFALVVLTVSLVASMLLSAAIALRG